MQDMTANEIDELLGNARIGRLSMADRTGRPYTIPLPFCWTNDTIYLRLPLCGRKGDVLRQNDQVCFEIDEFTETLDDYASVLIEGRLIAVADVQEKQDVKRANDTKYRRLRRGHRPGHGRATRVEELPLRKIVIERICGRKKDSQPEAAVATAAGGI